MKFSIVTPSYNQGQFIGQTIESVLSQKGDFEIEYFVMDGGSSDSTIEVLKKCDKEIASGKYSKYNKGIKFYWQSEKDKGQSDAINQGLKKSTGDIVAYLNSDDKYVEGAFDKIRRGFEQNPDKIWLTGYCNIVNEQGEQIQSMIKKYKNFWLRHYSYIKLLVLNFISQPATFWKKGAVGKNGLFDESLHYTMDYDFWLRTGRLSDPIIIRDELADFRIYKSSKGGSQYLAQFKQDYKVSMGYTNNGFLLASHRLHNWMITSVYRIIK